MFPANLYRPALRMSFNVATRCYRRALALIELRLLQTTGVKVTRVKVIRVRSRIMN